MAAPTCRDTEHGGQYGYCDWREPGLQPGDHVDAVSIRRPPPVPENWAPLSIQKNHYRKPPPSPPPRPLWPAAVADAQPEGGRRSGLRAVTGCPGLRCP